MVAGFAWLVDRMDKPRLVSVSFLGVVALLLVFWRLLLRPEKWVAAAFYIWVAIFSVLVVTLFWLVANDLYRPREAKRLFGFIGSGGILGGITGSSIAAAGARVVGTENLVVLSATLLVLCWFVVRALWRYAPAALPGRRVPPRPAEAGRSGLAGLFAEVTRSRYLLSLVALVGIAKVVSTFVYYQFNPFIETMFPDDDARTAFTGIFYGWMNAASFAVQFFLTSWILRRVGLAAALLVMPLGLFCGSLGLWLIPTFWLAAGTELFSRSVDYSLQQTSKEVLYLPIDRTLRYKVKPFIDMVVFRFGKGLAAVIGILVLDVLDLKAGVLSYLSVPLSVCWVMLVLQLRFDYAGAIKEMLSGRVAALGRAGRAAGPPSEELTDRAWMKTWLAGIAPERLARQKLAMAPRLFAVNGRPVDESRELLRALEAHEQAAQRPAGWAAEPHPESLRAALQDARTSMATRRYVMQALIRTDADEAFDTLLGMLMVEEEQTMRQELLQGLVTLRVGHPRLEFPKRVIRRQITKEAERARQVVQIAATYREVQRAAAMGSAPAASSDGDPVLGLLRLLLEETHQQIFRLLSLVYRPQDIFLVYHQLGQSEPYVRADAVELLDNLIDPAMRWAILPVLDEDHFLDGIDQQVPELGTEADVVTRVLGGGLGESHPWLSTVTASLVGRLRLTSLFADLDRAAGSSAPLLSQAARVGRRLAEAASRP